MLKALELIGFKSFATKTRFVFPPGITVVVGPNGSGKSNIVDAIKWVLGEQSVKSLRGTEMADVIFNGSGTRRGMNCAEITLTLDNLNGLLAIDTPEVHITRRVYRSGEGEYLINRQPCRLRDIRDLLAGTGMGTHAYSVIEQGKVDVLLQASPRDRRAIFEEAAGISRFKAKKVEAARRLERVEQNLLRLSDIVEEVENRLRSVRAQAGKARRYKEYTDRLQELRTQVALVDWRRLSERLAGFEAELADLSNQRNATVAAAESLEVRLLEIETGIGQTNEAIRQSEAHIAANRERIATHESTIEHERARGRDLDQEIARHRHGLVALNSRAGDLEERLRETADAVQAAGDRHRELTRRFAEGERRLTGLVAQIDQVQSETHQQRSALMDSMRAAAALGTEISALERQLAAILATSQKHQARLGELDGQLESLANELEELRRQRDDLASGTEAAGDRVADAKARLDDRRQQQTACLAELGRLRQRHSGMTERAAVLGELQRRHEGLSPGVKEVLEQARSAPAGPYRQVRGLVADLLRVSVEAAALIEIALGETSQHVVVAPGRELLEHLETESCRLPGRVGLLWLDHGSEGAAAGDAIDLEGRPGVLGRADRFVETDPDYAPLAKRLLGRTWVVEKLGHALALAQAGAAGANFVTLAGEYLAADRVLLVGPRHAGSGLIWRRSELRALKTQLVEIEGAVQEAQALADRFCQQVVQDEQSVEALAAQQQSAQDALAEHSLRITAAEERYTQMRRQRQEIHAELESVHAEHATVERLLEEARANLQRTQAGLDELEAQLGAMARRTEDLESERQIRHRENVEAKVELAKSEERLINLRGRMDQFEESQQERLRAIAEASEQSVQSGRRAEEARWNILRAESEVAELYLRKEKFARETVELINHRKTLQAERTELAGRAQQDRANARRLDEKIHAVQLAAGEIRLERSILADRLREDYGIELSELEHEPTIEEQQRRGEVQQEIDELRRKINNLGNVNLEALEELEQLEGRHKNLADQYKDLVDAKNALQRIIDKINADSRRLFADTLQAIKDHFGTLFRDLFGGGQADIVLEEGVDMLESGIEIVARPPGKELRSISLLSGGEKTLTCAALLLAIFRSRPSPFCVLDEVDAALDEANIDRFTKVLQDFLAWTQFIIVTHSKKTMTSANTIYGVTMQESGVSKQVSVRFEDVSDNGEILIPAVAEDEESAAEDEQAA